MVLLNVWKVYVLNPGFGLDNKLILSHQIYRDCVEFWHCIPVAYFGNSIFVPSKTVFCLTFLINFVDILMCYFVQGQFSQVQDQQGVPLVDQKPFRTGLHQWIQVPRIGKLI